MCRKKGTIVKGLKLLILSALLLFTGMLFPGTAEAGETDAEQGNPVAIPNLYRYFGRNHSYLTLTDSGYMRIAVDESEGGLIYIEYYDREFRLLEKKTLNRSLKMWGGFYEGREFFYLLEGAENPDEADDVEILRLSKYDKDWNLLGVAHIYQNSSLFGGIVTYPFERCDVEFAEVDNKLYIVTGHAGEGHQGFLEVCVDTEAMTGEVIAADLWHSFSQCMTKEDKALYILEMSEGNRRTQLTRQDTETGEGETISVLPYRGEGTSSMAAPTYASVDDVAVSGKNVFGLGTAVDPDMVLESHNVYLTVTPKDSFTEEGTTVKWLTTHDTDHTWFTGNNITKISDDRFLVMWQEYEHEDTIHYLFIDGEGEPVSEEFTANAVLSECHPVYDGEKVVYFASTCNTVSFYTIDAMTGEKKEVQYKVAGDNVTWELKDDTLTLYGTGPIRMEGSYEISVLSYDSIFMGGGGQFSAWKSSEDKIKKIVISEGITYVPADCFEDLEQLEAVEIGKDVELVDDRAFAFSDSLRTLTISSMDTKLGADVLWTGAYWIGNDEKTVYAEIRCPVGSEAHKYAKEKGIRLTLIDWITENGKKYYLYQGKRVVGWHQITEEDAYDSSEYTYPGWYYFNKNGELQTGWVQYNKKWYYTDPSTGVMQTGWLKSGKYWYYLRGNGIMATGWVKYKNQWYFMRSNGTMATGWVKYKNQWYFMKSSGILATNCWVKYKGDWYYMDSEGLYVTGTRTIRGVKYNFNSEGVCTNP